ncbi:hypothetical protein AWB76_07761 [Caballeronia temeraria]|uniref:Uncharacterized protein n=1 Tax=Caballeronia temeraria TaxID=1777137 RepID=A0A158DYL8_9BURK|nr:hypothetical protein AWB76_07761 [Caballeronia temeraria]
MGYIGVDHSELKSAKDVGVTGVHVSITAGDYYC